MDIIDNASDLEELHRNAAINLSRTRPGAVSVTHCKECGEVLRGRLVSNANINKAGNFRALVVSEIQMGTFDYAQRFPESKALSKFGTTRRINTFAELCDLFLESKSLEVSAASLRIITSSVNTLIRSRHSYQSRHTYACWSLSAGANPSFIRIRRFADGL